MMSANTREVLPAFAEVAKTNRLAAEAMSEPFLPEPNGLVMLVPAREAPASAELSSLLAIGVSYIRATPDYERDETPSLDSYDRNPRAEIWVDDYAFLAPDIELPYHAFRGFVDKYRTAIQPHQQDIDRLARIMAAHQGIEDSKGPFMDTAMDGSLSSGLRTVSAFAVFAAEASGHSPSCGFYVPEGTVALAALYREIIVERELDNLQVPEDTKIILRQAYPETTEDDMEDAKNTMLNDNDALARAVAITHAAICLPRIEQLERLLLDDPRLEDYQGLTSRADIRKGLVRDRREAARRRRQN